MEEEVSEAIILHGDQAVELLSKTPKDSLRSVATVLKKMEKPDARRMTGVIRDMGDKAEDALKWVGRYLRVATMAGIGGFLLASLMARVGLDHILKHPYLYTFLVLAVIVGGVLLKIYAKYLIIRLHKCFIRRCVEKVAE